MKHKTTRMVTAILTAGVLSALLSCAADPPPPHWVKVERRGAVVTSYASPDDTS